jgi:hypothetical protein
MWIEPALLQGALDVLDRDRQRFASRSRSLSTRCHKKFPLILHAQKFVHAPASRDRDARDLTPPGGWSAPLGRLASGFAVVAGHAQRLQVGGIEARATVLIDSAIKYFTRRT